MKYGIFSSVYGNYGIDEAAGRIKEAGFDYIQFVPFLSGSWRSASDFTPELIRRIVSAYTQNNIKIVGVSAGHSFVHPDRNLRAKALSEAKRWIELAPDFGTNVAVTEIGSTNPNHNWTDHPNNYTDETWRDVVNIYRELTEHAKKYGVIVGVEPHFAAVIKSAATLRKILDDVGAENLKVILDPANLITPDNAGNLQEEIEESFKLIGRDIILAHAKDTGIRDNQSVFVPAGRGVLPYEQYIGSLKEYGYQGPLLLEYLEERDVPDAVDYLRSKEVPPFLQPLFKGDPWLYQNVKVALDVTHASEGALELKYRLLLSMVADALQRHPNGSVACAKEAVAAGATREQVAEALRVVYTAGGLPALIENLDVYRDVVLQ